ncbi:MAG: GNAT family N-acetyltransferase [Anaerolineales bacterium]|nr:GNAT family N-acetyltransferase [Anaerolineales bacterium]
MQNKKTFEIMRLSQKDLSTFKSLLNLFNMVFEEEERSIGSDAYLLKLLGNDQFITLVAVSQNEVLGGITAYELPMAYSDRSEIFLYDMAVKTEHQRTGVGKKLIQSLKEYCIKNKIETFFVMAHEEDGHAIEFYHATGGKSEKVVNFLYEVLEEKE